MKISKEEALSQVKYYGKEFVELFKHGSLTVEVYKPSLEDRQKPHDRDEIYVVIAGQGIFFHDGDRIRFKPGDFLFVPAGVEHRFEQFSEDFSTWVFFYGPKGGEQDH